MPQNQIPPNTSLGAGKDIINDNATDAETRLVAAAAHSGSTDGHPIATISDPGFLSAADWGKLDSAVVTTDSRLSDNRTPTEASVTAAKMAAANKGVVICTSTTRPASSVEGQHIYETDTDKTLKNTGTPSTPVWAEIGGGAVASLPPRIPYRVPTNRLVIDGFSGELAPSFTAAKAIDGINDLSASPDQQGWLTGLKTSKASQVGSYVDIVVGPMYWVALGDSITVGQPGHTLTPTSTSAPPNQYYNYDNPFSTYAFYLQDMQGRYVHNAGIGGEDTAQMLSRMGTTVNKYKPDICSVLGGTNDIITNVAQATIESNLTAIYNSLVSNGTTPVLCTIPPHNNSVAAGSQGRIDALNTWIRNQAAVNGWPLADVYAVMEDPSNPGKFRVGDNTDAVHPSPAGYARLATAFEPVLSQITPAPEVIALGLSSGQRAATPVVDYAKPDVYQIQNRTGLSGVEGLSQSFGISQDSIDRFIDVTVNTTKLWIDHINLPPRLSGPKLARIRVRFKSFAGVQTDQVFAGLGEVQVYAK